MIVNGSCLRRSLRLAASSSALATGLAFLPNEAYAQCAPIGPTQVICSGANTTTQSVIIHDVAVSTIAGFSVDTTLTGGHALAIEASGSLSYNDVNATSLTGADMGLRVLTMGDFGNPGSIFIDMAGVITGQNAGVSTLNRGTGATNVRVGDVQALRSGFGVGMSIVNELDATDLTINAGNVVGAFSGIYALNGGTGNADITATGQVGGGSDVSLHALNNTPAGDLSIRAGIVHGGNGGILAENFGHGATHIVVDEVIAADGTGIKGYNGTNATDLTIGAGSVIAPSTTGGNGGIQAQNGGTGATRVTSTGTVVSGVTGIFLSNSATATSQTVEANNVTGAHYGIFAFNQGTGTTRVTSTGDVASTAAGGTGIHVQNGVSGGDVFLDAANVTGADGIYVQNDGTGATVVTTTGTVAGTNGNFGVLVNNMATATDLTVNVANVTHSRLQAISIVNEGIGATNITATGNVIGGGAAGMSVRNGATATDLRINAVNVTGRSDGIFARNEGIGATAVIAAGQVVGTDGDGISVSSGVNTTGLTIEATHVSGRDYGILANSASTGNTLITATGVVTGSQIAGIAAYNFGQARDLRIETVTVNGGIDAVNGGVGTTSVTATGMVTGAIGLTPSAIRATSNGQPIDIMLSGAASGARNRSGLASDLAVTAVGGPVSLTNEGRLTGGVSFSGAFADRVVNKGLWSVAGTSDFGTGVDAVLSDPSGTLRASGRVLFNNLESFISRGMMTMQNGAAGDRFITPANISLMSGSRLAIDINAAGVADSIQTTGVANITNSVFGVSAQGVRAGRYTVVTADVGLIGTFGSVTGIGPISAFAAITDSYDATNAYLDVLQVRNFADAGLTRNQKAAAAGVQSLSGGNPFFAGNPLYDAIL